LDLSVLHSVAEPVSVKKKIQLVFKVREPGN